MDLAGMVFLSITCGAVVVLLTHRPRSGTRGFRKKPMNTLSTQNMVACSFCGKNQNEVAKIIAGPQVNICDECIDLCNEIIEDESVSPDELVEDYTQETSGGEYLTKPQIVTRYTKDRVTTLPSSDLRGWYWMCEGCGWRLKLAPGAKPPSEHSEEIALGYWPEPPGMLPPREVVPACPNPNWRRVFEPVPREKA